MVLALLVTGLIWRSMPMHAVMPGTRRRCIDAERGGQDGEEQLQRIQARSSAGGVCAPFPIILVVLVLRSFPSSRSNPLGLHDADPAGGDDPVNKFSYGIRLPVVGAKISARPGTGTSGYSAFLKDPATDSGIKRNAGRLATASGLQRQDGGWSTAKGRRRNMSASTRRRRCRPADERGQPAASSSWAWSSTHEILVENSRPIVEGGERQSRGALLRDGETTVTTATTAVTGARCRKRIWSGKRLWGDELGCRGITWNRIGEMLN
ncbi:MAG: hypothetical protein IPK65_11915 [Gammaproteobacteria bacterium]|nr:hypothetical protein [Gammaproteobacteria bacterium]